MEFFTVLMFTLSFICCLTLGAMLDIHKDDYSDNKFTSLFIVWFAFLFTTAFWVIRLLFFI